MPDALYNQIIELIKLVNHIDHREEPSFTPNVSVRVDSEGVFWVEVDSPAVTYLNNEPMIEEAHSLMELVEVCEEFARRLANFIDTMEE